MESFLRPDVEIQITIQKMEGEIEQSKIAIKIAEILANLTAFNDIDFSPLMTGSHIVLKTHIVWQNASNHITDHWIYPFTNENEITSQVKLYTNILELLYCLLFLCMHLTRIYTENRTIF